MAQKQRKTVPNQEMAPSAAKDAGSVREFLKAVPMLAFLIPPHKRSERRLRDVKRMFSKILSGIVPALAEKDPDEIHELLQH